MNATKIINSITLALDCEFDRDAAVKRLKGAVNSAGPKTLQIKKDGSSYSFYSFDGRKAKYLSKSSPDLYRLSRKRYCLALINLLESLEEEREEALTRVAELLEKFEVGNLELSRIVLSNKQYAWYTGSYAKKPQSDTGHILGDEFVKSKSEQEIGTNLGKLCIPFHYEERLKVYVKPLVDQLANQITTKNSTTGNPSPTFIGIRTVLVIGMSRQSSSG